MTEQQKREPSGRKPIYPSGGRRRSVYMANDVHAWLKVQPGGISAAIDKLVREAMKGVGDV